MVPEKILNPEGTDRWRVSALLLGIWSVPGIICAAQVYLHDVMLRGLAYSWIQILYYAMPVWWVWAVVTPLIIRLAQRFRIVRPHWARGLLFHIPVSLVFTVSHLIFYAYWAQHTGLYISRPVPFWDHLYGLINSLWFHVDMLAYWLILGGYYALDYYRKFQEREVRALQLETRLAQAQLHALKMQLHPHFLFNTLNALSTLVLKVDTDRALQMLNRLSDLLRVTLDQAGVQEVELEQELAFIEQYLAIEQVRFQDRLRVDMDIDPAALNGYVPNLILQPLVENAIRHGIAPRETGGLLTLRAKCRKDRLWLEVEDNGPGLPEDFDLDTAHGIGLTNTQTRLEQLYGSNHRFYLKNKADGGLCVILDLPFHRVRNEPVELLETTGRTY